MQYACKYAICMTKTIQLRNVPDDIHRTLKARAALAGLSLSDYLLAEARRIVERPTLDELKARLATHSSVKLDRSAAEMLREERGPL